MKKIQDLKIPYFLEYYSHFFHGLDGGTTYTQVPLMCCCFFFFFCKQQQPVEGTVDVCIGANDSSAEDEATLSLTPDLGEQFQSDKEDEEFNGFSVLK